MATYMIVPGGWAGRARVGSRIVVAGAHAYSVHADSDRVGRAGAPGTPWGGPRPACAGHPQCAPDEKLSDVILCAHSYGGMVITGVAEKAARLLKRLVYIDAMVPRDGESAWDGL